MKKEEQSITITEIKKMAGEFGKIISQFKELGLGKIHMKFSENVELTIEDQATQVVQTVQPNQMMQAHVPTNVPAAPVADITPSEEPLSGHLIKAPLVGTFYESAAPGEKAFVTVGQTVSEGDVLCIVESMKVMNEIKADKSGKIKSINVSNEQLVEFDQVLFVIE